MKSANSKSIFKSIIYIHKNRLPGFNIDAKCSIKEEDVYGKTEVFNDIEEKINLTNSNYYQELVTKGIHLFNM